MVGKIGGGGEGLAESWNIGGGGEGLAVSRNICPTRRNLLKLAPITKSGGGGWEGRGADHKTVYEKFECGE